MSDGVWWFLLSMRAGTLVPRVEATCRDELAMAGLLRVWLSQYHVTTGTCILHVQDVGDATWRSALAVTLSRLALGSPLWMTVSERLRSIERVGADWRGMTEEMECQGPRRLDSGDEGTSLANGQ